MIICLCEDISYSALLNIIDNSSSVEEVFSSGVCSGCSCCYGTVCAILEDSNLGKNTK